MAASRASNRRRRLWLVAAAVVVLVCLAPTLWAWVVNRQAAAAETGRQEESAPGRFVQVDGYRFHYELFWERTGPAEAPLVLVHGFGLDGGATWSRLAPLLSGQRPVLVLDMLGAGYSERVAEPGEHYTVRGRAAHLAGLLDELGYEQVDLAGASYGGAVAAQFALDYPQRVRRLVLLDAQIYGQGGGFFGLLGRLPLGIGRALSWTSLLGGPVAEMMVTAGCETDGYCPTEAELAERRARVQLAGTTDALMAINDTRPAGDVAGRLGEMAAPVLVVWGEADTIVPLADGRRLAVDIPGAELAVVPGAGHSPQLDAPAAVAELLAEFLAP